MAREVPLGTGKGTPSASTTPGFDAELGGRVSLLASRLEAASG